MEKQKCLYNKTGQTVYRTKCIRTVVDQISNYLITYLFMNKSDKYKDPKVLFKMI